MATVKELQIQLNKLEQSVDRLQKSNSDLRDEIAVIKSNYTLLVKEMSTRLELIHNRFQGPGKQQASGGA
mgnify:CR=1 FL=1